MEICFAGRSIPVILLISYLLLIPINKYYLLPMDVHSNIANVESNFTIDETIYNTISAFNYV